MSKIGDVLEKLRVANKAHCPTTLEAEDVALMLGYIVTLEQMVEKAVATQAGLLTGEQHSHGSITISHEYPRIFTPGESAITITRETT